MIYLFYVSGYFACTYVWIDLCMYAWQICSALGRPEEGTGFPGTRVKRWLWAALCVLGSELWSSLSRSKDFTNEPSPHPVIYFHCSLRYGDSLTADLHPSWLLLRMRGYLLCWENHHPSLPLSAGWLCVPGPSTWFCISAWLLAVNSLAFFFFFFQFLPLDAGSQLLHNGFRVDLVLYLRHYRDEIPSVSAELSVPLSGKRPGTFAWSPLKVAVNAECRDQHFL